MNQRRMPSKAYDPLAPFIRLLAPGTALGGTFLGLVAHEGRARQRDFNDPMLYSHVMKRKPERVKPKKGQESVWDYPRPPRLEASNRHIVVVFNGVTIADTGDAWRVLETSHPPVYYIPPGDVNEDFLVRAAGTSWCEWKGQAHYYTIEAEGRRAPKAAWAYADPLAAFEQIRDHIAFYCGPMDRCLVDGEEARAQPGGFYGGWITDDIVGPFKGEPGTSGW